MPHDFLRPRVPRPSPQQNPSESPRATAAERVWLSAMNLSSLQRSAGNRAVASALTRTRPRLQRADDSRTPADLDPGFNPQDVAHRLVEAIDQSDLKPPIPPFFRHVDLSAVVAALDRRTVSQIRAIDAAYASFENHRSLRMDLLGNGESGFPTDLTQDGRTRVRVLLDATAAAPEEGRLAAELAQLNRLDADAAELHAVLKGDLGGAQIERVMALLRRDAESNLAIAKRYKVLSGAELQGDLGAVGATNLPRAQLLFLGQTVAADQLRVAALRGRIERIDASIGELRGQRFTVAAVLEAQVRDLRTKRSGIVAELEAVVGEAGAEARRHSLGRGDLVDPAAAHATADRAATDRMATVLGGDGALASAGITGADATALRALATGDPVGRAAAHLHQLRESGKLDAAAITEALRGLREQADVHARQEFPLEGPRMQAEAAQSLAGGYIGQLPARYDAARPSGARTFEQVAGASGTITDMVLNQALRLQGGRLDPVQELRFALAGDRKDLVGSNRYCRASRLPRSRRSRSSSPSWRPSCSVALRRRPVRTMTSRRPWPS